MDIWRIHLDRCGMDFSQILTDAERARAACIVEPERRLRWARGRGVLRTLLASYLERPSSEIELASGPHGKPELAPRARGPQPAIGFNLSHSGPLALCAFAPALPVGIDLECLRERTPARRRPLEDARFAERIFGVEQAQRLQALAPPARARELLRLWVRHEAALKCVGRGLFGDAAGLGARASGVREPGTGEVAAEPWVVELDLGGGDALAALAVQGDPQELRLWEWLPAASEAP